MKPHSLQTVQVIGHRGSAKPYPENTLEAIIYGILSGAKMVEIDLRLSKDKEVILFHDENLSRMAGINQNVSEMTWEELSKLPIKKKGETFYLIRLRNLFKILPREVQFYLELKASKSSNRLDWDKKLVDEVIFLIKKERMKKRCLIMSFDHDLIRYMKKEYPSYSMGIIVKTEKQLNTVLKDRNIKLDCLAVNYKLLKKRNLHVIKNSSIPFIVWTVNSKKLWREIVSCRPLGIVTDYPEKFSDLHVSFESQI